MLSASSLTDFGIVDCKLTAGLNIGLSAIREQRLLAPSRSMGLKYRQENASLLLILVNEAPSATGFWIATMYKLIH